MKTKRTKGEWKYHLNFRGDYSITVNDESLAFVLSLKNDKDNTDLANAKLIAAAPKLLEVLSKIRGKIQYEQGRNKINQSGKDWSLELKEINNAIKEAIE